LAAARVPEICGLEVCEAPELTPEHAVKPARPIRIVATPRNPRARYRDGDRGMQNPELRNPELRNRGMFSGWQFLARGRAAGVI
jgi:hypothetical protein